MEEIRENLYRMRTTLDSDPKELVRSFHKKLIGTIVSIDGKTDYDLQELARSIGIVYYHNPDITFTKKLILNIVDKNRVLLVGEVFVIDELLEKIDNEST